jgi:hypothetical protein
MNNKLLGLPIVEIDIEISDDFKYMLVPHTCEHCKFWGKPYDVTMAYCNNEVLIEMIDGGPEEPPYFHKDFGCIFWEGKE